MRGERENESACLEGAICVFVCFLIVCVFVLYHACGDRFVAMCSVVWDACDGAPCGTYRLCVRSMMVRVYVCIE